jgi:hypothetical protein
MLAPFTAHYAGSMDDIGDGRVGISMTFQDSFEKVSIEGNYE